MGICYATSRDGISWDKPELGLVDYEGSTANNIVWRGGGNTKEQWGGPHGTGILRTSGTRIRIAATRHS